MLSDSCEGSPRLGRVESGGCWDSGGVSPGDSRICSAVCGIAPPPFLVFAFGTGIAPQQDFVTNLLGVAA